MALDAFSTFGFPPIPDNALKILQESKPESALTLSIITSSEGYLFP